MSETNAPTTTTPPAERRKPRRRFRWYTRLLILVALLVVAILVIAQILFWTDVPRKIVEGQISSILHVRASLGSLKIGWMGDVEVRDLTLQIPTEDSPFLTVDAADLKLAPLFIIAFDQEVRDLEARGVDLSVRQQANGRWNLQQLFASAKGPSPTPSQPTDPARLLASLPSVRVTETQVSITKNDGKQLVLPDVRITLSRTAPLTTGIEANVGDDIAVKGSVATLGTAPHEVAVVVTRPPAGLDAFLGTTLSTPASARLTWTGRLTTGGVAGTLALDEIAYDVARANGKLDVTAGGSGDDLVVVRPVNLSLGVADASSTQPATQSATAQAARSLATSAPAATRPTTIDLLVSGGAIRYGDRLRLDGLRGTIGGPKGGRFAVDGIADITTYAADVRAAWEDVAQAGIETTGHATLRTERLFTGKLKVAAGVGARATLATGDRVGGTVALEGEGSALDAFGGIVTIEPLTWTPKTDPPVVTPALVGDVTLRGSEVSVSRLRTTDPAVGSLLASATFDRASQDWYATLDARGLRLPPIEQFGLAYPIDANVAVYGNAGASATVQQVYAKAGPGAIWAAGFYDRELPKPVRLDTWAWFDKPATDDNAAQAGSMTAVGVVEGTLMMPRDVDATMNVNARQLVLGGREIGDVAIDVVARVTDDRATLVSREMDVLGGRFNLDGGWEIGSDVPPTLTLNFVDVPVQRLGELASIENAEGMIDEGRVVVRVNMPVRLDTIEMTANARGTRLASGPFAAETLTVSASLKDGEFRAAPILREGTGTLDAMLVADATLQKPVRLGITLDDWPAPNVFVGQASTQPGAPTTQRSRIVPRASAKANVEVSLSTGAVRGELNLNAAVNRGDARLADVKLDATINDRLVRLHDATINTLDGTLKANGQVDLNNINGATFTSSFDRLAPAELAWLAPPLADFQGRLSGTSTVGPATGSRPLGPLQLTLAVRPEAGTRFRSVSLGDVSAVVYANYESPEQFRIVSDTISINVADGTVRPFARFSYNAATGPSQLVTVRFDELDLDQLTRAIDDDGKPVVGRLGGTVRVYGPARTLGTVGGEARLEISRSDLANVGPIAALYNVMNIGTVGRDPTGEGTINARLEAGTLTITDANYFNRGVYATIYGPIRNVEKLTEATIDKVVLLGSLQPLRDSKIPLLGQFFGDVNETLAALQSSVAAIQVTGTAKEPIAKQIGLNELGGTVTSILLGKTQE